MCLVELRCIREVMCLVCAALSCVCCVVCVELCLCRVVLACLCCVMLSCRCVVVVLWAELFCLALVVLCCVWVGLCLGVCWVVPRCVALSGFGVVAYLVEFMCVVFGCVALLCCVGL